MATRTVPFGGEVSAVRLEYLQAHREEILEQLDRLLASPQFRTSRYYPKLLHHVVHRTLEGGAAHLKERAVGSEVFGRKPGYDTNQDPVVRTSACEVRKRIAQYYHEPEHAGELRIDLPSGSYVAEFQFPQAPRAADQGSKVEPATAGKAGSRVRVVAAGVVVLAVLALGLAAASRGGPRSALEKFWAPVWSSTEGVLICVGGQRGMDAAQSANGAFAAAPSALEVMKFDRIDFADALTMGRLFRLIGAHGKRYEVRRGATLTLNDLRRGPVVLIGGLHNSWTMRLQKRLRFTFLREGEGEDGAVLIRDRENPAQRGWRVDPRRPYRELGQDYAIVSRVMDPLTERTVVTVAGITKDGTVAAGDFVSEERYLAQLAGRMPAGWERKNLEVVLGTEVVNGVPGPPRVLGASAW